ncbi:uncharacterized protein LOC132744460 [Ruditapes philippinarum]|uniref:uncharacterized protein LOC132744460 n=1 Tax=Ruditapes philippinarum TaxID=129788 RepID=UPI00295C127F|nr:uncharacterized protein LOC132744460 [Ruditapes philippinarum]
MYNKCFKVSFYARCYGAALRSIFGPAWSPIAFQQFFEKRPDKIFLNTYKYRVSKRLNANKSSKKKENILRRKRKREESSILRKKGKADYGEEVLIDTDDISKENLELECENYFKTEIMNVKIDEIEKKTRGQSSNDLWHDERKKRLTSSIFGDVMSRSLNNNSSNIIKRLLYSKFKGNIYTIRGQNEEENARIEYKNIKNKSVNTVKTIQIPGLVVDKERPYLASSSDGIVISEEGPNGLIEIKTLLNNSKKLIHEAAESDKNFCLKMENGKICLKRNHKYFYQIQGQLNILDYDWCDLVVRRINPNDIFIERIFKDKDLWERKMVPKLKDFYFSHMLPELAVPRHGTVSGIRKPSLPWHQEDILLKKRPIIKAVQPDKCSVANAPSTSSSDRPPSCSQSKRIRKQKFVGRRINHQWKLDDGSLKWYIGSVLSVTKGKDGYPHAVYQVLHDGEDESYDVEYLQTNNLDGSLKFIDI